MFVDMSTTVSVTLAGSLLEQFLCTAISKLFKLTLSLVWGTIFVLYYYQFCLQLARIRGECILNLEIF